MRITADVIDEEPCVECSDLEQDPPKREKRLRLVVKGSPKAKSANQYRFMFNTMLKKFKQLDVSDSFMPVNATVSSKVLRQQNKQVDTMAAKDSAPSVSNQNVDQEWLSEELSKMKKEITKDVTKNVLHHLMGALRNTQESVTKEVDDSLVHKGIYCDNCDQIICGIRYKCGNCSDYDLCEVCENIPEVHDGNHIFLKIRNPMPQQSKPKRRRKKVVKTPASCGNMRLTIDLGTSKTALSKLADFRYKMNAKFLHDVTIPDGFSVAPGSQFLKSWKVMNSGNVPWTHETSVVYMAGSSLMKPLVRKLEVPKLQPGEEGIVSVVLRAPVVPGIYRSYWGFVHKDEEPFGDHIWCMVKVAPYPNAPPDLSPDSDVQQPAVAHLTLKKILVTDRFEKDSNNDLCGNIPSVSKDGAEEPKEDADTAGSGNNQTLEETAVKQNDQNVNQVAEVLTAVHKVQERGEIVSRKLAAPSSTATPNNTPFDLSPPKSPEPQDPGNKDIQLGAVGVITGTISTQGKQSKIIKSGAENEDKSSVISLSSSESDAEFVVIPMPKCFAFGEPLSTDIQPVVPSEKDLQAGSFSEGKPEEETTSTQVCTHQIVEEPEVEKGPHTATLEEAALVGETRNLSIETTVKLIENEGPDNQDKNVVISQITVDCSSPEFSVISSEVQSPEADVQTDVSGCTLLNHLKCLSVNGDTGEEERESEVQIQDQVSSGTYPKVPLSTSTSGQMVTKQEERTIQVLPEGLVTGALSAAATVYNTARAVISSMQVRNDQNPETEGPQSETTFVPPQIATMDPMQQLVEMGFCNRPKNEQLLKKHNGDVAFVVAELVGLNDNDWYDSRHAVAATRMADFD